MANAFGVAEVKTGVTAPAGSSVIRRDAVDDAVAALGTSHIMSYIRAKTISDPTASFYDRLYNLVTASGAGSATKSASDADFNNLPSINLGGVTTSCYEHPSGLGLNLATLTPPISFTVLAVVHAANPLTISNLFGTSDGFQAFFGTDGKFNAKTGSGDTTRQSTALLTAGATQLVWFSYYAGDQITRVAKNGVSLQSLTAHAAAYAPTSGAKVHPFGNTALGAGRPMNDKFAMFAMFNYAYMTGADATADANFTALVNAAKTLWGL